MEIRYDDYLEDYFPYTMTLEELFEKSLRDDTIYYNDKDVLAYIRHRGEKFTCLAPASTPENLIRGPLDIVLSSGRSEKVPCKIFLKGIHNVLKPMTSLWPNHFASAYKIQLTPIEFDGCIETFYFSDFVSLLNEGHIVLIEREN